MAISDIPGYIQGFRFSDDAQYWDSGNSRFIDQAGYGDFNGLTITAGTPSFTGSGATRGLILDNTVQGKFLPACPWQGACIVVMQPVDYDGATATLYPFLFGVATSVAANGNISLQHSSSTFNHRMSAAAAVLSATCAHSGAGNSGVKVCAFAISQETRKGYSTKDGVTVTETGPVAAADSGIELSGKRTASTDGQWARFGNLSGTIGDVVATSRKVHIFEAHWFRGNPLVTDAATVATEIAALKAIYGAT